MLREHREIKFARRVRDSARRPGGLAKASEPRAEADAYKLQEERSKGSSSLSLSRVFRVASRRGSGGATRRNATAEEATRSTPLGVVQPARGGGGGGDRP